MTIDERLDRLADRHEALAQSVEMLTHSITRLEQNHEKTEGVMQQAGQMITGLAEAMAQLARVVQAHEHRLERLEGGA